MERLGKLNTKGGTGGTKETVRHLNQDTGTISSIWLTAAGTAMIQINQYLKCLPDYLVGFLPLYIDNKTDAARVMLELRIVEALFCWWSVVFHSGNLCDFVCIKWPATGTGNFY